MMTNKQQVNVLGTAIRIMKFQQDDYISLTDIAKHKGDKSDFIIQNRMRNRNTIEFLWLREKLYNPDFNPLEFEGFRKEAGLNAFLMSPKKWITTTQAIGILSKSGKYGWTFAHKDIALEFAIGLNLLHNDFVLIQMILSLLKVAWSL